MLVKIDVLWSWELEIRRNAGGRIHWKRPPTHPHPQKESKQILRIKQSLGFIRSGLHKRYFRTFPSYLRFRVASAAIFTHWSLERVDESCHEFQLRSTWKGFLNFFIKPRRTLLLEPLIHSSYSNLTLLNFSLGVCGARVRVVACFTHSYCKHKHNVSW